MAALAPLLAACGLLVVTGLLAKRLHLGGRAKGLLWAASGLLVAGAVVVALATL
ncbi:hypothetical protein [Lacticaseibacillus parakribbianus]|uniref:hypothetical protein n=1 Tax=Lacticaseibacillus parakribbianus TaxID=2970927 RepID=UPI0021CB371A|nr:hypothetical protein [Lacticaseibacillus parakribbianus]